MRLDSNCQDIQSSRDVIVTTCTRARVVRAGADAMMQSLSSGAGCARAAPQPAAVRRARLLPRASATAEPPAAVEPAAAATDAAADADARPGVLDAEAFSCSPSVEEWRDWRFPSEGSSDVQSLGQELAAAASDVQVCCARAKLVGGGLSSLASQLAPSTYVPPLTETSSAVHSHDRPSPRRRRCWRTAWRARPSSRRRRCSAWQPAA